MSGWSLLGNFGRAPLATVDRSGAITFAGAFFSLTWGVGDESGWYRADGGERRLTQRRSLRSGAPVFETALQVEGGEVVMRCAAATDLDGGEALLVEFANESPIPVVVSLGLEPQTPLGSGQLSRLKVTSIDAELPGDIVLRSSRPWSAGVVAPHDVWADVSRGAVTSNAIGEFVAESGDLRAALLMTVPHRTAWSLAIAKTSTAPRRLPDIEAIGRGWDSLTRSVMRSRSPVDAFDRLCSAAVVDAAMHARRQDLDVATRCLAVGAAAEWGFSSDATAVLDEMAAEARYLSRRRHDDATLVAIAGWAWACGVTVERDARAAEWAPTLIDDVAEFADVLDRAAKRRWRRAAENVREACQLGLIGLSHVLDAADQTDAAARIRHANAPTQLWPLSGDPREARAQIAAQTGGPVLVDELSEWIRAAHSARSWADGEVPGSQAEGGDGCSARASAIFALCARRLLVREDGGRVDVFPVRNDAWLGENFDLENVPVGGGARLSVAARYRGPHYALLWEATGPLPSEFLLTASGLDPAFALHESSGQVLLSTDFSELVAAKSAEHAGAISSRITLGRRR